MIRIILLLTAIVSVSNANAALIIMADSNTRADAENIAVITSNVVPELQYENDKGELLLLNKSNKPVVEIGRGSPAVLWESVIQEPFNNVVNRLLPVGWNIYAGRDSDLDKIKSMHATWGRGTTWTGALSNIALQNDVQVIIDWESQKVTIVTNLPRGIWQSEQQIKELAVAKRLPIQQETPQSAKPIIDVQQINNTPQSEPTISLEEVVNQKAPGYARVVYSLQNNSAQNLKVPLSQDPKIAFAHQGIYLVEAIDFDHDKPVLLITDNKGHSESPNLRAIQIHQGYLSENTFRVAKQFGWFVTRKNEYVWIQSDVVIAGGREIIAADIGEAMNVLYQGVPFRAVISSANQTVTAQPTKKFLGIF